MHPLHESRKAVVGDAGVLCGVIGRLGSILVITHLPIAWGGDDSTMQHKYIGDMVQHD